MLTVEQRLALFAATKRRAEPQSKAAVPAPIAKPQPAPPAASRFAHLRNVDLAPVRAALATSAARRAAEAEASKRSSTAELAAAIVAHTNAARGKR